MFRLLIFVFFLLLASPCFADSFTGKVIGVSDGDTITVLHEDRGEKVRLNGIDCPEKAQAFGQKAKQKTSDLAYGKGVTVIPVDRDRYGRTVGEVVLPNETSLNKELVAAGMCWWYRRYAPDDRELAAAESNAKAKKLGLWVDPNPMPPWEFRHGKANNAGPVLPTGQGNIVGNRNSHVYHFPGCPGYNASSLKNRVYFESEQQAIKAGFRKAANCR